MAYGGDYFDAAAFERWNIVNRVVAVLPLDAKALQRA
jgi:enoyl-CoA hydratase/carnithine racemase